MLYFSFNSEYKQKNIFWGIFGDNGIFHCALICGILGAFFDLFRTAAFNLEKPYPHIFMITFVIFSLLKYKYDARKYNKALNEFLLKNKLTLEDFKFLKND